ncbi:transposase [Halobiforma lacisalsi AJ5]|uniref:Transposase n=1 Tax=Natronobacterium lacisalsi AJ5 TaxID=358396 RepID=M0LH25_NATLA|nr:hypothetical protein [Halobiforma lacisalsi]APW99033.1 transposase [Halobiforma lacisalsi AJ5]EMA31295.1 hypothetical protein C445_14604 [Halobiforma lacisalsi AJ5]
MTANDRGTSGRSSRRRFLAGLAGVGGVALAGCSALSWNDETSSSVRFSAGDVDAALGDVDPVEFSWPVPVRPDSTALEGALERVDTLLADVPDALEPEDVPNGVVRTEIVEQRDEATAGRDDAGDATGDAQYHALRESRSARQAARHALTSWFVVRFADEDDPDRRTRLLEELRDERGAVRSVARDRHDGIDYRGTDTGDGRLRASLYAYRRESDLARAAATLDRWSVAAGDDALELGESAGELEHATATVEAWDHLDERYRAGLESEGDGEGGTDLQPVFEDALERSIEAADAADFPEQDEEWLEGVGLGDLEDSYLEHTVWRAGQPVDSARKRLKTATDDGELGTALHRALEFEVALRAFESVRDRIAGGGFADPSLEDVLAERSAALEAAEGVRDLEVAGEPVSPSESPSLAAYVLAETLRGIEWADDGLRRAAERDPETNVSLGDQYRDYAIARGRLEGFREAVETFRGRVLE